MYVAAHVCKNLSMLRVSVPGSVQSQCIDPQGLAVHAGREVEAPTIKLGFSYTNFSI